MLLQLIDFLTDKDGNMAASRYSYVRHVLVSNALPENHGLGREAQLQLIAVNASDVSLCPN